MIVRKKASVHEKTVQKVARGEIKKPVKMRATRTRSNNSRVKTTHIDPMLKQWIAEHDIDPRRITILGEKTIVIANPKD